MSLGEDTCSAASDHSSTSEVVTTQLHASAVMGAKEK